MTKTCYITVQDEVWCTVAGITPSEHQTLSDAHAPHAEGYFFQPKYKMGVWDGRVRFYSAKTGKTYVRLLDKIVPYLDRWGYNIELRDSRQYQSSPSPDVAADLFGSVIVNGREFKLRPYQIEAVNECISAGSGVVLAGTGAGKTSITAALSHVYSSHGHRTITVVPSSDLVDQTASWYSALGMDTGIYSGSEKNINHLNVVATWQALQYNPTILSEFQAIIWDEFHGAKSAVAGKLLNENGRHIAFRFGVTGTFPKPETDQLSLLSSVGPILKEIPAKWLIDNGYLSQVQIYPVELNETYVDEEFPDYESEKAFISKSPARLEKIADIIVSQAAQYGNTLVLVHNIKFGEKLASLIDGAVFLYGNSPKDLRQEHYAMFEQHDNLIVIASSGIASTGISIDRVFALMLVDAGKSFIKCIQSLGRGLRKGRDKDSVVVFDIHSKLKWAKKHAKERLKHYRAAEYPIAKTQVLKIK